MKKRPPRKGTKAWSVYQKRSRAAKRGARTKRLIRESIRASEQAVWKLPPKASYQGGETLSKEEALPVTGPRIFRPVDTDDVIPVNGAKEYETERYQVRERSFYVGKSPVDIDVSELLDSIVRFWQDSFAYPLVHVIFLWLQYIPFNPAYKGALLKKSGTWDGYFTSTKISRAQEDLKRFVTARLNSAWNVAQRKILILEQFTVRCLAVKKEVSVT